MGADIHFVVEIKLAIAGPWVGVYSSRLTPQLMSEAERFYWLSNNAVPGTPIPEHSQMNIPHRRRAVFSERNYDFFAKLAGVRGNGPAPRGIPNDISDLTRAELRWFREDGHSHSWASLLEFTEAWLSACDIHPWTGEWVKEKLLMNGVSPMVYWLSGWNISEHGYEYRVVYWFDN